MPLAPSPSDASQDISTSRSLAVNPGDFVTVTSTKDFFVQTHATSATATASSVPHPAGVYHYVIPDGVGSIAIFSSVSGAPGALWRS